MELKQVQTFVVLAETLHFGHAAQQLRIAQPHVSRRIKQLEEELDVLLFYRDKRNVRLTEAGEVFLGESRKLLRDADIARMRARESAYGRRGNLNVGLLGSAMLGALSGLLGAFHHKHPDVHLTFRELSGLVLAEELGLGTIDVAFFHPPVREAGVYQRVSVEKAPLVAVLPEKHRLADRDHLRLVDLAADSWVMFPRERGPYVYDLIISLCQRAGFSPRIVQEAESVHARLGLVAAGFGVHLVHDTWRTMPYPGVVYATIEPTASIGLSCYWRSDNTNPILHNFVEIVRKFRV